MTKDPRDHLVQPFHYIDEARAKEFKWLALKEPSMSDCSKDNLTVNICASSYIV